MILLLAVLPRLAALVAVVCLPACLAQAPVPATSSVSFPLTLATPAPALTQFLAERLAGEHEDVTAHYAFIDLHRDLNYIKGGLTGDHTRKTEQIFIGGLPYRRRLERDGKPLAGKDLERENALYEQAVKERAGLSEETRRKMLHDKGKYFESQSIPVKQLTSDFRADIAGRDVVDGHECVILDLQPLRPDAPPALQRHMRFSLDAANGKVLRNWVEYLVAADGLSKGTTLEYRSFYRDGDLLPQLTRLDTTIHASAFLRSADVHLIGTDEYSNYRRFGTTVTLGTSAVVDEGSTAPESVPPAPR